MNQSPETVELNNINQALNVIISAIDVAQSRGAFKLEEAELLFRAKQMFTKKNENENENENENKSENKQSANSKST